HWSFPRKPVSRSAQNAITVYATAPLSGIWPAAPEEPATPSAETAPGDCDGTTSDPAVRQRRYSGPPHTRVVAGGYGKSPRNCPAPAGSLRTCGSTPDRRTIFHGPASRRSPQPAPAAASPGSDGHRERHGRNSHAGPKPSRGPAQGYTHAWPPGIPGFQNSRVDGSRPAGGTPYQCGSKRSNYARSLTAAVGCQSL